MPLATDTAFAGYTVLRLLGSGGMGEVYLARHPRLPRQDALKVLHPDISVDSDYRRRFAREAELAAKLSHPNIVSVHDCGEDDGRLWISMQYVDGTDGARLLADHYPSGMPLPAVVEIVTAVASALDHAHGKGILHRDVKPSNILISQLDDGERRVLLGDFGIARDLGDSGGLTVTNTAVGTVAYAAPEQLVGRAVDGRADQYALAATAFHLLTGSYLFPYSNPAVVIGQHLSAPPPSLRNSHPELAALDAVLDKALAKDPRDRFGSCMEFARALAAATAMPPPPTYPTLPHTPPAPKRWLGLLAATALLVVVGLVAYLVVNIMNRPEPSQPQFALTGTVHLNGEVTTSGLPSEFRCAGAEDLGDVSPRASVTVEDEAGKLLSKGSFDSSYLASGSCIMSFTVDNVPSGAKYYRVKVARQDDASFTEAEAKAGVDITLGNSEPNATTNSTTPAPTRPSTTTSTVPDAEQQALSRLRAMAADDKPYVAALLNNRWVPQLSSKYKDLEAEGTVWTYQKILQEHLALRQQYPRARLLWSSDWPVFEPGYWVTVNGIPYDDYRGALTWCTYQGRDRDHCFAKLISTTHGPDGTTQLNP